MYRKYTILCMQTYTILLTFTLSTVMTSEQQQQQQQQLVIQPTTWADMHVSRSICVLNVHKFVDEGYVHIDVYTNVYLLYTIFLRVYAYQKPEKPRIS